MTRPSILAVSALAALSSSCIISSDALAQSHPGPKPAPSFSHQFGARVLSVPTITPHPVAAPSSANGHSFAATRFSKARIQANSGNSSHEPTGHQLATGPALHTGFGSAVAAMGCGAVCRQAGTGSAANGGNNNSGGNPAGGGNNTSSGNPAGGGNNTGGVNNNNGGNGGGATATAGGGSANANGGSSVVNVETSGSSGGGAGGTIGQIASTVSVIGQVQEAAPAQQAAAPVQRVIAQAPVQVAQAGGFRAIALGWNNSGAWVVRTSPTLAGAGADAVQTCNAQFGECTLSGAQVAPTSFGCLVAVQSDDSSRVFAAAGNSSDTALAAAAGQITNAGLHGQIVYSGCNS